MPKVTRDDVARLAGTSTAVVSYVINNGPRPVAPATRERVLAAIKQLGYRPDRVAQAMASRRTDLIGLIVPDARQPFFAEMAHAVEQAASERGKMVLVGNSDYLDEREVHYLRAFLGMRVSGLILISQGLSDNAATEIDAWDARCRSRLCRLRFCRFGRRSSWRSLCLRLGRSRGRRALQFVGRGADRCRRECRQMPGKSCPAGRP